MTQAHPMLLHIIVANAALHMSNAGHRGTGFEAFEISTGCDRQLERPPESRWSLMRRHEPHRDALAAKQRALCSLREALTDVNTVHTDVTLATVLLFTEFELLDSGRDTWKHHINGARKIIAALWRPELSGHMAMSPLRSCLISTCLVYGVLFIPTRTH